MVAAFSPRHQAVAPLAELKQASRLCVLGHPDDAAVDDGLRVSRSTGATDSFRLGSLSRRAEQPEIGVAVGEPDVFHGKDVIAAALHGHASRIAGAPERRLDSVVQTTPAPVMPVAADADGAVFESLQAHGTLGSC